MRQVFVVIAIFAILNASMAVNQQLTDEELQWQAIGSIAKALAPVIGSVVGNLVNNNGGQDLSALYQPQDMKFSINGCIKGSLFGFGGNLCMGNLQQQMEDQDLQW
jgi:hypothetical protein